MTGSSDDYDLLDLENDLPTTKEDSERLWELSQAAAHQRPVDWSHLLAPGWTLEKAASRPLFSDDDEPFEL